MAPKGVPQRTFSHGRAFRPDKRDFSLRLAINLATVALPDAVLARVSTELLRCAYGDWQLRLSQCRAWHRGWWLPGCRRATLASPNGRD